MKVNCPNCRATIPAEDISLPAGWAKCRRCDEIFKLADIVADFVQPAAAAPAAESKPERPYDAWTLLERDGEQLIIVSPARGMRSETWGLLAFTAIWLGFIAFWTLGALGHMHRRGPGPPFHWEHLIMALFTIPFWMAGLGMLGAVFWSAWGVRRIYLDASILYFESRCITWRRGQTIAQSDVQHARAGMLHLKNNGGVQPNLSVEVVYRKGSFRIPVASEAEQKWLMAAINDFFEETPCRPSPQGDSHFHTPQLSPFAPRK